MALASMICCLTRSARAECSASVACCSGLFTGTNFISGRRAASHSAAASAASFLRPRLTNGLTASGATSFTVCPSPLSTRPHRQRRRRSGRAAIGALGAEGVGRPARLQHHRACGLHLEEPDHLAAAQLAPDLGTALLVDAVDLKAGLGGVEADHDNAHGGRFLGIGSTARTLARRCRQGPSTPSPGDRAEPDGREGAHRRHPGGLRPGVNSAAVHRPARWMNSSRPLGDLMIAVPAGTDRCLWH